MNVLNDLAVLGWLDLTGGPPYGLFLDSEREDWVCGTLLRIALLMIIMAWDELKRGGDDMGQVDYEKTRYFEQQNAIELIKLIL